MRTRGTMRAWAELRVSWMGLRYQKIDRQSLVRTAQKENDEKRAEQSESANDWPRQKHLVARCRPVATQAALDHIDRRANKFVPRNRDGREIQFLGDRRIVKANQRRPRQFALLAIGNDALG